MFNTQADTLDELLQTGIASIDISAEEHRLAESRYHDVADSLDDHWDDSPDDGSVYPQGSMRLGTVTRNIHRNDEIDIDLVALRRVAKESTTQASLKADAGAGLTRFVEGRPEGLPRLEEGKRCWTLIYPGFHLDVLPALPDTESRSPTGLIITDTQVRNWRHSNPIGYADWFHATMKKEFDEALVVLSKSMDIDEVPRWVVKTTLQRAVQSLKRHRDIYFTDHLEDRPASVIITTLAARAYRGGSMYEVLADVTRRMPELVPHEGGRYIVANPVQPKENFADRWADLPDRAEQFFKWAESAALDFASLGSERGLDVVLSKMSSAFGERVAKAAAARPGTDVFQARRTGALGMAAGTGALTTTGVGRRVRDHDFHGDAHARP